MPAAKAQDSRFRGTATRQIFKAKPVMVFTRSTHGPWYWLATDKCRDMEGFRGEEKDRAAMRYHYSNPATRHSP